MSPGLAPGVWREWGARVSLVGSSFYLARSVLTLGVTFRTAELSAAAGHTTTLPICLPQHKNPRLCYWQLNTNFRFSRLDTTVTCRIMGRGDTSGSADLFVETSDAHGIDSANSQIA